MDANGNIIPIVEGDQGEGFKDEIDPFEEQAKSLMDTPKKQGVLEDIQLPKPPPLQRMTIRKGMTIHFYGYAYKCTAARPNGKVTLKFKGLWKGDKI